MPVIARLAALFGTLTWAHYKRKPGRLALAVLGVALAVAVSTAIRSTNDRVIHSFSSSIAHLSGKANLQLTQTGGIDAQRLWELNWLWDVGYFSPFIKLETSWNKQRVDLYAFDFLGDRRIRQYELSKTLKDQPPKGLWVPQDSDLAGQDSVELVVGSQAHRLPLAGTIRAINGKLPPLGAAFVDLSEVLPWHPRLSGLDIWVEQNQLAEVQARLAESFPTARIVTVAAKQRFTSDMLEAFQMNLGALGLIALLVSCYLVYNAMNISVLERRRDLNVLAALGAKEREVFLALMLEGLFFGLLGGLLGAVGGWALSRLSYGEVSESLTNLFYLTDARLPYRDLSGPLGSMALGVAACLLAAWHPARRAVKFQTAQGLKQKISEFDPKGVVKATGLGLGLIGLALTVAWAAFASRSYWMGFISIFSAVTGLSFLAPLLLERLVALLARGDGLGLFLRASIRGHLFKLSVAVAALAVSLSMAGSVAVMVHSFRATLINWMETTIQADLYLKSESNDRSPAGELPPEVVQRLSAQPWVEATLQLYMTRAYLGEREVDLAGVEFAKANYQKSISFVSGSPQAFGEALEQGGVLISEVLAEKTGLGRGDALKLAGRNFEIFGVFRNYSSQRGLVYLDVGQYKALFPGAQAIGLAVFLSPGLDAQRGQLKVRELFKDLRIDISQSGQIKARALEIFDQTFRMTKLLQLIAFGISILAVVASLSAMILERKGELALLLALGAKPAMLRWALLTESWVIASAALLLASLGAFYLSWMLIDVINRFSFGWTIVTHIPWGELAETGLLILAGAALASLVPIRALAKAEPAQVLKSEGQ
ncbi:MAG: FtsX-like permease family protein [bacterium]|nr:FtsX-like permease family protein [bacterium]